jgi:methylisocitrate lyase
MKDSPGDKFRQAVATEKPLQVVGTINAYVAIMAKKIGFQAIYLSGAGVANSSYGLPDLGMTTLDNVLIDVNRIVEAVDIPLLVDVDTGWGNALMVARTIKAMEHAGAAAVHIEDQVFEKKCGHLQGKALVAKEEMVERIKAAVDARKDDDFVVMARTDAFASEGFHAIERCLAYEEAGADMHFLEALVQLEDYKTFRKALSKPILANITEFGKTPLWTTQELATAGVDIALYPLSANRAMNLAALKVFNALLTQGTQKHLVEEMQTREELYGFLDYDNYARKIYHVSSKGGPLLC